MKCKNKQSITSLIDLYSRNNFNYEWQYGQDQNFLEEHLFPFFKKDCIDHSSHKKIRWEHSVPFPEGGEIKFGGFVGDRVNPVQARQLDLTLFSPDSKNIFLFMHQAVDDFITCNGLIRMFSDQFKNVLLPVKRENLDAVSFMLRDIKNLKTIPIIDDNSAFNLYLDQYKNDYRFVGAGFWNKDPSSFDPSNPQESFYKQFKTDPKNMKDMLF